MSTDRLSNKNPAEPKAIVVTVAESGLPENPEIVADTSLELTQEDKSSTEKTQDSNHLTKNEEEEDEEKEEKEKEEEKKEEEDKPEVTFAPEHTRISYEAEEDTLSMISFLLEDYLTSSFFIQLPRILSKPAAMTPVELKDKFTQTFFKAMTKLSNRRFVEIINMQVDHEDPTLVFFCPSYELLTSFHENVEDIIN